MYVRILCYIIYYIHTYVIALTATKAVDFKTTSSKSLVAYVSHAMYVRMYILVVDSCVYNIHVLMQAIFLHMYFFIHIYTVLLTVLRIYVQLIKCYKG